MIHVEVAELLSDENSSAFNFFTVGLKLCLACFRFVTCAAI